MIKPSAYAFKEINKCFKQASDKLWNRDTVFDGPTFPNPHKDRQQMQEELEDHYSNSLFDMTDEELINEYNEKIGEIK